MNKEETKGWMNKYHDLYVEAHNKLVDIKRINEGKVMLGTEILKRDKNRRVAAKKYGISRKLFSVAAWDWVVKRVKKEKRGGVMIEV